MSKTSNGRAVRQDVCFREVTPRLSRPHESLKHRKYHAAAAGVSETKGIRCFWKSYHRSFDLAAFHTCVLQVNTCVLQVNYTPQGFK